MLAVRLDPRRVRARVVRVVAALLAVLHALLGLGLVILGGLLLWPAALAFAGAALGPGRVGAVLQVVALAAAVGLEAVLLAAFLTG